MTETRYKLDEADKGVLKLAAAFEPMIRSEGWHEFMRVLDDHVRSQQVKVNSASLSIEMVLQGEGAKGALAGLQLAKTIVPVIVEQAREIRKLRGDDPERDD